MTDEFILSPEGLVIVQGSSRGTQPKYYVKDRIEFVKDFMKEKTNLDCSEYLSQILTLDMLTLNTDRHLNNLGIIVNEKTGTYKTAPVFDNGACTIQERNS